MEKEKVDKDGFNEDRNIIRQINSYPSSSNTVRLRLWINQKVHTQQPANLQTISTIKSQSEVAGLYNFNCIG